MITQYYNSLSQSLDFESFDQKKGDYKSPSSV